jgi:hypothetical protein
MGNVIETIVSFHYSVGDLEFEVLGGGVAFVV